MKSIKIFIMLIFLIFCLTGCSNIRDGVVIEKEYKGSYITMTPMRVGKIMTVIPVHHGESYNLKIKNGEEERWVIVSKEEYEKCEIGDYYE